jgi:hypothetical protein
MIVKTGNPKFIVSIWTDDLKFVVSGTVGDPNSDILSIATTKDLLSPSGTFEIVFTPRIDSKGQSWFDKLDAFDYVEIEFQGIDDSEKKIVMRGLIDEVNRSENFAAGVPQRSVTISGRDLGALLVDFQIYYLPELSQLHAAALAAKPHPLLYMTWRDIPTMGAVTASQAFYAITGHLRDMIDLSFGGVNIKNKLNFLAYSMFPEESTTLMHLMSYEGSFWNSYAQYEDKPFHELFLYDAQDSAYLILRPARLKDAHGAYHPSVVEFSKMYSPNWSFSGVDKVSMSIRKHGREVRNYFLTLPKLQLVSEVDYRTVGLSPYSDNPENSKNPFLQLNSDVASYIGKYGFRKYEAATMFMDLDPGRPEPSTKKPYEVENVFARTSINRNDALIAWYLHNPYLLEGNFSIRGTNSAMIGTYVTDTDEDMVYYVEGVTQSFVTNESFLTQLRVSRGMPKGGLVDTELSKKNVRFFGQSSPDSDKVADRASDIADARYYGGLPEPDFGTVDYNLNTGIVEKNIPTDISLE